MTEEKFFEISRRLERLTGHEFATRVLFKNPMGFESLCTKCQVGWEWHDASQPPFSLLFMQLGHCDKAKSAVYRATSRLLV